MPDIYIFSTPSCFPSVHNRGGLCIVSVIHMPKGEIQSVQRFDDKDKSLDNGGQVDEQYFYQVSLLAKASGRLPWIRLQSSTQH